MGLVNVCPNLSIFENIFSRIEKITIISSILEIFFPTNEN